MMYRTPDMEGAKEEEGRKEVNPVPHTHWGREQRNLWKIDVEGDSSLPHWRVSLQATCVCPSVCLPILVLHCVWMSGFVVSQHETQWDQQQNLLPWRRHHVRPRSPPPYLPFHPPSVPFIHSSFKLIPPLPTSTPLTLHLRLSWIYSYMSTKFLWKNWNCLYFL